MDIWFVRTICGVVWLFLYGISANQTVQTNHYESTSPRLSSSTEDASTTTSTTTSTTLLNTKLPTTTNIIKVSANVTTPVTESATTTTPVKESATTTTPVLTSTSTMRPFSESTSKRILSSTTTRASSPVAESTTTVKVTTKVTTATTAFIKTENVSLRNTDSTTPSTKSLYTQQDLKAENLRLKIALGILSGLIGAAVIGFIIFYIRYRRQKKKPQLDYEEAEPAVWRDRPYFRTNNSVLDANAKRMLSESEPLTPKTPDSPASPASPESCDKELKTFKVFNDNYLSHKAS